MTVSDPETGAVLEERIVANDYCLITAGNRTVKRLYRERRGGGDVSLDFTDGWWEVLELVDDCAIKRRWRWWLFAYLDYRLR